MIEVHSLVVGPVQANCHVLLNAETREAVVVDPGDDPDDIAALIARLGAKVTAIWNTHGHFDHINANGPLHELTGAPITIHALETAWLGSGMLCGASLFGVPFRPSKADYHWSDGDQLQALGRTWVVHHTPGHSPGLCCIACAEENLLITGDLLFSLGIGRTDLPGGDPAAMERSLRSLFMEWGKDAWRVYCGHGGTTTVGQERQFNPYVKMALAGNLAAAM